MYHWPVDDCNSTNNDNEILLNTVLQISARLPHKLMVHKNRLLFNRILATPDINPKRDYLLYNGCMHNFKLCKYFIARIDSILILK